MVDWRVFLLSLDYTEKQRLWEELSRWERATQFSEGTKEVLLRSSPDARIREAQYRFKCGIPEAIMILEKNGLLGGIQE